MDWNHKIEQQRDVLLRIVALLFALAELADDASTRSRRVRRKVLSILLRGEAVARQLLSWEVLKSGKPVCLPACPCGDRVEDAMQLADCFRAHGRRSGLHHLRADIALQTPVVSPSSAFGPPGSIQRAKLGASDAALDSAHWIRLLSAAGKITQFQLNNRLFFAVDGRQIADVA